MRTPLCVLAAFVVACGTTPPGKSPAESNRPAAGNVVPPTDTPKVAPFDVHEWGVIDVSREGAIEVGAGPGAPTTEPPRPVKKPVLYFHLDPGAAPVEIAVTARIPRGSMLEVWPAGQLGSDVITWPKVRLHACPMPLPPFADRSPAGALAGWPTRDGYNEVRELAGYETSDAACLTSESTLARLLFYRGATRSARLPLEIVRDHEGALAIRASAVGNGQVFFVTAGGRGVPLAWPPPDHPVALPEALTESLDGAAQARLLEKAIIERGLTPPEATAFMNAWAQPFFNHRRDGKGAAYRPSAGEAASCKPPMEGPPASIIYLMPDAAVNEVATLAITPTPRTLKRVMVVRIELP